MQSLNLRQRWKEFKDEHFVLIKSVDGAAKTSIGSALLFQAPWMKDFATEYVAVPIVAHYENVAASDWYSLAILVDAAAIYLLWSGIKNIGEGAAVGDKAFRTITYTEDKSLLFDKIINALDEYGSTLGLAGYVTGDAIIGTAWWMNQQSHQILNMADYGLIWNNIFYFLMIPSASLLAAGAFAKGVKRGEQKFKNMLEGLEEKLDTSYQPIKYVRQAANNLKGRIAAKFRASS